MFFRNSKTGEGTDRPPEKPDTDSVFESSEKKLEIVFSDKAPSLRSLPESFWRKVSGSCGASVVSSTAYPSATAFLLSESSLLVWDHRIVMITCGKTTPAVALLKVLKAVPKKYIDFLFFQRKNEFFPENQKSRFSKDLQLIQRKIQGGAWRFGPIHQHHCFLFCMETDSRPQPADRTLEALMYDSKSVQDTSRNTMNRLKARLQRVFAGFEIQDHHFAPTGYSLNAVRGEEYYTIHITPQAPVFYISFEAGFHNRPFQEVTDKLMEIFKPQNFDLIFFHTTGQVRETYRNPDFCKTFWSHKVLNCGYEVSYMNFQQIRRAPSPPQAVTFS